MKMLVLDMDGTIANLYGVEDWLPKLQAEDASPYREAELMYKQEALLEVLNELKELGWRIAITTWLCKGSSAYYDSQVREAKLEWLEKHAIPYDEIHLVKYGTQKETCTAKQGGFQVLVDDNNEILDSWNLGSTIDAKDNILEELWKLTYFS